MLLRTRLHPMLTGLHVIFGYQDFRIFHLCDVSEVLR
jgi:hypothetical protein